MILGVYCNYSNTQGHVTSLRRILESDVPVTAPNLKQNLSHGLPLSRPAMKGFRARVGLFFVCHWFSPTCPSHLLSQSIAVASVPVPPASSALFSQYYQFQLLPMWSLELLACQWPLQMFLQKRRGSVALFTRESVNICNLEPDLLISRLFTRKLVQ